MPMKIIFLLNIQGEFLTDLSEILKNKTLYENL